MECERLEKDHGNLNPTYIHYYYVKTLVLYIALPCRYFIIYCVSFWPRWAFVVACTFSSGASLVAAGSLDALTRDQTHVLCFGRHILNLFPGSPGKSWDWHSEQQPSSQSQPPLITNRTAFLHLGLQRIHTLR